MDQAQAAAANRGVGCLVVVLALCAVVAIGPSLWLDARGTLTWARVTGKREQLVFERGGNGEWTRRSWLAVRFTTPEGREHGANVKTDPPNYDRTRVGSFIRVRYLPCCPIAARAADRSTTTMLREFAAANFSWWVVWLPLALAAMIYTARSRFTVAAVASAAVWVASVYVLFFADRPLPGRPEPPLAHLASARVLWVHVVRESEEVDDTRQLPTPYQVVEFAFSPGGAADTLRSADAVDSGSVQGLREGAVLPVRYDARNPRSARLVPGTRTFPKRNRRLYWMDVFMLGALPAFFAVAWHGARAAPSRSRRRKPPPPASAPE